MEQGGWDLERPAAVVMLPRTPKQDRSRRKQSALVDAAERLFCERGFDDVSAEDIAATAGFPPATFYNYFANKTQVFLLVADRHLEAIAPVLAPLTDAFRGGDARLAIRASIEQVVAHRREIPWLRKIWLYLSLCDPQVCEYQRRVDDAWQHRLASLLEAGIALGLLREVDPVATAVVVRVAVDAVADEVALNGAPEEATIDALTELLTAALRNGHPRGETAT